MGVDERTGRPLDAALLGILKAGGAYLPLDPSYPQERLRFMLEDAAARVLVTEARLAERLGATAADVVCLETDRELFASDRTDNLESGATPDNLAYVIFTSGSTGRSKGVKIDPRRTEPIGYGSWRNRMRADRTPHNAGRTTSALACSRSR
jgi:non-ribosomal peptide synthetase component F